MATEENNNQEEVLEESEQEELVEAPEQDENQPEVELSEKSKVKEDDDEDDDDDDEEEEEDEQVKKEEVKIPSTKAQMIKSLFDKINGMKKEEVSTKWKELMSVAEAEDVGGEDPETAHPAGDKVAIGKKKKKIKIAMPEINVKEDIDALVQGEQLSEEFKTKASTIFEAAVHQKVMEVATVKVDELEKEFQSDLQEEIVSFRDELTDKVDGYLNYVVEEWMRENEIALESSLRSEITEEFMGGLKNLFTEHYIDVPDEKVDIVEGLYDKVEELEEKLNSQVEENMKVKGELNEYRKDKILEEVCEDLADTQAEKMKTLVEGVNYENDSEDFENKVKTIKENYFPNQVKQDENVEQEDVTAENNSEETPVKMSNIMEAYSKAIARK
tara:strand:- start:7138 stop:8295 length:1158 start_codon:yes stop_codon:yes gene_type:complete